MAIRSSCFFSDDRTDESGSGHEAFDLPATDARDLRTFVRRKRNIERMERMMEAVADCLDERFLARPAIEEPARLIERIERRVHLVFRCGEKTRRDIAGIGKPAH